MPKIVLSVVVPVFNEEEVIQKTHSRLTDVMVSMGLPYEIIYVNDGSIDQTYMLLRQIHQEDPHAVVVNFSRNFGQQAAVSAGLDAARGQAVVIIDADLQDPPEVIPDMVRAWREGADVAYGKRISRRGESWFKKFTAKVYYRLFQYFSKTNAPVDTGDFRLMDKKVVNIIRHMDEKNRYLRGMVSWTGFNQVPVEFERDERAAGETKYSLKNMLRLAGDGIFGFSSKPLSAVNLVGLLICFLTLVAVIVRFIVDIIEYTWNPMVYVLCLMFFLVGLLFLGMGLLGNYIGRIYDEVRNRPLYIVGEFWRAKEQEEEE